jgi:IS5 family transposase
LVPNGLTTYSQYRIDTTVQEKNITFPTDAKLYRKIIVRCLKLARKGGIKLRRSYAKEIKQRKLECRFAGHPRNRAKARKAVKRLKTIAGRLVRELERKLPLDILEKLAGDFALFHRGLNQKRHEFGTKVSITTTRDSKIIVVAMAFDTNKFDGHTLPEVLLQLKRLNQLKPAVGLCDRGYKGKSKINDTWIIRPSTTTRDTDSAYKALMGKLFRKRAGIAPVIDHLESDHRLNRSYLKGFEGDQINVLMAAAAFNFRKWMRLFLLAPKTASLWNRLTEFIIKPLHYGDAVMAI